MYEHQPRGQAVDTLWMSNRRILAERLKWPDGALAVAEGIERMFPTYAVWWGTGRLASPRPGYYAWRSDDSWPSGGQLYGAQADDLIATIQADIARIAEAKEKFRLTKFYPWQ
jgi:hypothetical protein